MEGHGGHGAHDHHGAHGSGALDWAVVDALALTALLLAATAYAAALWASRHRSPWPRRRTAAWAAGLFCAGLGVLGPVAAAARESFTAHMAGHLLLGMLAPLLLVLGSPIALALRALPQPRARALSRVLRHPVVRWLTHPVVAGALNAGGLWLLYATELYGAMHRSAAVFALVHLHLLLAGYLFTASLVGVDPDPHRASFRLRAGVLIVFIAAHSILAKWLWAHPPAGVEPADGRVGAELMYYGGDAVDVILIVLLFAGWFRATRPRGANAGSPGPDPISAEKRAG
ncbi:cytochrome c oxidase assembly protein [Leucobacter massiliensis]|uniref:Cytochrome C oxidase assembly protein n=1 Tax=Leucobacter massiliensis TaxID=1686285 RepID=A0A2S9QPP9_9MICO|nr:cytochrome c oxidase assembly protein [Leucobacter massiliensis]PRI11569.1 hypothetical protein B4915_05470 [Leucobacter massiliensis]